MSDNSKCTHYNKTWGNIADCIQGDAGHQESVECNKWVFVASLFHSTIVTEVLNILYY